MSVKQMALVWEYDFDHAEQSVMLALADHAHDDGTGIRPSVGRIAWKTGYSERQVYRILKDLRDEKAILVLTRRGGRGRPNEYAFDWSNAEPKRPYVPIPDLNAKQRQAFLDTLLEDQGPVCTYCGRQGDQKRGHDGQPWHVDRVIPGSAGGQYTLGNVALSCGTCNRSKGANMAPKERVPSEGEKGAISEEKGAIVKADEPSSIEPSSIEPSVVGAKTDLPDDTTARCLQLLLQVKGFPRDQGENALKLAEVRDAFPACDPVEVCEDFKAWVSENPFKSKDKPRLRLRNFFKSAAKRAQDGGAVGLVKTNTYGVTRAERNEQADRNTKGYEEIFSVSGGADEPAEPFDKEAMLAEMRGERASERGAA